MELIKRKYNINNVTGGTVNFSICLYQTMDDLGYMSDLGTDLILNSGNTVTVTGITENKLSTIKSYDFNNPYKVGINGVTQVTLSSVTYNINDIIYVTNLNDLTTTFSFQNNNQNYENSNFIFLENNILYTDKPSVDNEILIERQNISVIENFSKIRQISAVSELATFNNGFYVIFDQTI